MSRYQILYSVVDLCLVSAVQSHEFQDIVTIIRNGSMEESKTIDLIEKTTSGEFKEDESLKCYLKCTFSKFKLSSRNWKIMLRLGPPHRKDKVTKVSQICDDFQGDRNNLCDFALYVNKSASEELPDNIFVLPRASPPIAVA